MAPRLASGVLVSALIRHAQLFGGNAAVLCRGDEIAGGIIVILSQRGEITHISERGYDLDGRPHWRPNGDKSLFLGENLSEYIARRRARDPDLWAIDLDVADSERFAAEMTAMA